MNILNAIINLVGSTAFHLQEYNEGRNRANNMGTALEEYVKDIFSGSSNMAEIDRLNARERCFSYLGNANNPPDAMLRDGDAIEIKKIESQSAALALNSSYPKHKLYSDSTLISNACRDCEAWTEKDMIYVVGVIEKSTNNLIRLFMVYGLDYCASEGCYTRIKELIKNAVEATPNIDFEESNELGHINRVDPLGITYMRVRGMWGIDNPWKTFNYLLEDPTDYKKPNDIDFDFMCIINEEKWDELDGIDEFMLFVNGNENIEISEVRIKNPDNPSVLRDAKLIKYKYKREQ